MKYSVVVESDLQESGFFSETPHGVLMASSWEDRSGFLHQHISSSMKFCINVIFTNAGTSGRSLKNRKSIRSLCKKNAVKYVEVKFNSTTSSYEDLVNTSLEIQQHIGTKMDDWLIDITSMPRRLWASLFCLMDQGNFVRNFHFFYAHPNYEMDTDRNNKSSYIYTSGEWLVEQPAFAKPKFGSGLFRRNIFSIGFEYDNLKKMFSKFDSDDNRIIYSSPGYTDQYTDIANATIEKIKHVFEISDDKVTCCRVNDFQSAINLFINHASNEVPHEHLVEKSIICTGNKIHALAMLVCSLERPEYNLYMRVPRVYLEKNTKASGLFDLIHLENLLAPFQS